MTETPALIGTPMVDSVPGRRTGVKIRYCRVVSALLYMYDLPSREVSLATYFVLAPKTCCSSNLEFAELVK